MLPWLTSKRKLSPKVQEEDWPERLRAALRVKGVGPSIVVAAIFAVLAWVVLLLSNDVTRYRPGDYLHSDVFARVDFSHFDQDKLERARERAMTLEPNVYSPPADEADKPRDVWGEVEQMLLTLPDRVKPLAAQQLDFELASVLDAPSLARLQEYAEPARREEWKQSVEMFLTATRKLGPVVLDDAERAAELADNRMIRVAGVGLRPAADTLGRGQIDALADLLMPPAQASFRGVLPSKIVRLTMLQVGREPTHRLDDSLTAQARNAAVARVPEAEGVARISKGQRILSTGVVRPIDWELLRAEHRAFHESLGIARPLQAIGLLGVSLLIAAGLSTYVAFFQPRLIENRTRAVALAGLLLAMLLVVQLAAIGSWPLMLFGVAPTLLVAMTLTIAYDRRFAIGVAAGHALLATIAAGSSLSFLIVLLAGVGATCFATGELRTRSKLVEVGGVAGLVLMAATLVAGLVEASPLRFVATDALYAGGAGLGVGFLVLGALPFVERVFRITTPMSLLELADTGHPLLRKLCQEAPGTYHHSMQVANLCEEAAVAIGADSLLARVGAYYHDVGKMNKPGYFVENQKSGDANRHIALSPHVSKMIIIGHVKDGWELARQYNLPTSLIPFIRSHHGTTVVEYFYHQAQQKELARGEDGVVEDHEFRYPGPKPKSREVAILMLADAAESACRAIDEPTASRITTLVHDITEKRLLDGQLDECDLTMRELHKVRDTLVRTLIGIYHPRIAYPSSKPDEESGSDARDEMRETRHEKTDLATETRTA